MHFVLTAFSLFVNKSSKTEYLLVKEYSRPAAGKTIKPSDLRSESALLKTIDYLINK
jgi:hypothetical protein